MSTTLYLVHDNTIKECACACVARCTPQKTAIPCTCEDVFAMICSSQASQSNSSGLACESMFASSRVHRAMGEALSWRMRGGSAEEHGPAATQQYYCCCCFLSTGRQTVRKISVPTLVLFEIRHIDFTRAFMVTSRSPSG